MKTSVAMAHGLALMLTIAITTPGYAAGAAGDAARPHGDVRFTVLQTTDIHDHANGADHLGLDVDSTNATGIVGAYSRIAAYIGFVRATAGHPVVLVDSGDWTMGTPYDLTLGSQPLALRFLKAMHYDCVTLGNHEFDYTPAGLALMFAAAQSSAGFQTPIVASNMDLHGDTHLAPFVGPGKLIQTMRVEQLAGGLRVGYLGLMGRSAAQDAAGSAPVRFAVDYGAIQSMVDTLRQQRRAQIVIVLSHSGTDATGTTGEDIELARHVTGIDLIASGHTHTPLAGARTIPNGSWTTRLVDAGAFGTNVARIDLTWHATTGTVTMEGASNVAMTDASLTALRPWLVRDTTIQGLVHRTDGRLNQQLAPFFAQAFPDFAPGDLGTGLYHPVAVAAQDMVANNVDPVLAPNGLGDLAADALRNVPNGIIAGALAAAGGNPANLPGYDVHPFQAAVVASGVLRGGLEAGVPSTFADVYDVLPLGISPDPTQPLPVGFPTISAYLEPADLGKLCALQLVAQSNLVSSEFYLNLSGIRCNVGASSYTYFKYATAAAVLATTSARAVEGSSAAQEALAALGSLAHDQGAALLAASRGGNPFAVAMVQLNDPSAPSISQTAVNLAALGQVATAAATDAAAGTTTLDALIIGRAIVAIDSVSAFAPGDATNTGDVSPLPAGRSRIAADLYAILLLGAVEQEFGIEITPFASASGGTVLSASDLPAVMANRIDADPATAGVQELKEWMALLSYVGTGLDGSVPPAYASTPDFSQFPTFGAAVQARNASYPLAAVAQLATTVGTLQAAD